jgi:hypothetical protein
VFAWRLFVQVDDLLSVQGCEWGDCKSERMHFVIDMIVAKWHYRGVGGMLTGNGVGQHPSGCDSLRFNKAIFSERKHSHAFTAGCPVAVPYPDIYWPFS